MPFGVPGAVSRAELLSFFFTKGVTMVIALKTVR
jgi:hypothetical protein